MYTLVPLNYTYHPTLLINLSVIFIELLDYKEKMYDFINCDYSNIISDIASLDWNGILNCSNVNVAVNNFFGSNFKIIGLRCLTKYMYTSKFLLWI